MNRKLERPARLAATLAAAAAVLGATACSRNDAAQKAEYWLCAKAGGMTMPDGVSVTIWGWVADAPGFATGCAGAPRLPGPALGVPWSDPTLTIHVRNLLPEPTSIVIPGLTAAMTPVWFDGDVVTTGARSSPTQRVRSFTHEAAPNGGEATYVWSDIRPGTFLYHSGTHPQVQVQMGLYGAVVRKHLEMRSGTPLQESWAYEGVTYRDEIVAVFSEIDPDQHLAIANGTYGTAPKTTLRYAPKYYLVNGRPYDGSNPPLGTIHANERTLLRLLNAGLQSYVPAIHGMHMRMIAEDGHPYPWGENPREQVGTLLGSLKTVDALIVPPGPARYPLYDRRLNLTTGLAADGGMLSFIAVTP